MTCPACRPMCATFERQLAMRLANMKAVPDATVHPCGVCGGIDWATTDEMVRHSQHPPPSMWRRLMNQYFGSGQ